MSAATNCPACGGPVRFTIASAVTTVCEYCRSVVARTDIAREDLGKVGQLVDTGSPLSLGLTGKVREGSFRVVGHIQIRHHAGGVWNEWFLHFGNDWGWLAEAQGRFFLSFPEPDQSKLDYGPEALELGKPAPGAKGLTVAELGTGTFIAAISSTSRSRVGGAFRYSMITGSSPLCLIIASVLRDVPHSGL